MIVHPPSLAERLVTLFAPADSADLIIGDLSEEFSGLAADLGLLAAENWYWRQALKTVVPAGIAAFQTAPWLMSICIAGGYWLTGFATSLLLHAAQSFLDSHRIYELNPSAYLFWYKFPLEMGRVVLSLMVGGLVALTAKGREMAAVISIAIIQALSFLTAAAAIIASGHAWFHWFSVMLLWNGLCSIAFIVAGALVRTRRSKSPAAQSVA